jgi:ribosomal-protein-serine acetyltransferase
MTMQFSARVDDDIELVLADEHVAPTFHRLVLQSLHHLQPWEELARDDLTLAEVSQSLRDGRRAWAEGRAVPTAIRYRGEIVGAVGARIDREKARAEIGYWIDAAHQGRGIVTRSVGAMVDSLFLDEEMHRVELRTAADNHRSRAVAERLSFVLEGTLREAYPLAGTRRDLCIYARLASDPA